MFERIICALFGHRYVVLRKMNPGARKVGCTRCKCQWAMHDGTRSFVQWSGEFDELYAPGGPLDILAAPSSPSAQTKGPT